MVVYLAQKERDLFFKLYFDLLYCVNKKHKTVKNFGNSRYPKSVDTHDAYKIREKLFENPAWIDEYIRAHGKEFNDEELSILTSWRDHFVKDMFILMKNLAKYSVLMSSGSVGESALYGVIGLNHSIAELFDANDLPLIVNTVILPFKDKIIYDGIMTSGNILIGPGMRSNLNTQYKQIKERYGICESLPFIAIPKKTVNTTLAKTPATKPSQELYDSIAPIITNFCSEHLNEEYAEVSLRMLGKL